MTLKKSRPCILITCGPTREPIDGVRYITNRSTGTMGFELARSFLKKNYAVTLAAGPIPVPEDIRKSTRLLAFETTNDLKRILAKEFRKADALCMCAAVADYRTKKRSSAKIKRSKKGMKLDLESTPDLLEGLKRSKKSNQVAIGFSVESRDFLSNSKAKVKRKGLDFLAAQRVGSTCNPFGSNPMQTTLFDATGKGQKLGLIAKKKLAGLIAQKTDKLVRVHLTR